MKRNRIRRREVGNVTQYFRSPRLNNSAPPPPVICRNNSQLLGFRSSLLLKFILIALVFLLLSVAPASAQTTHNVSNVSEWQTAMDNAIANDIINITASFTLSSDLASVFTVITINGNNKTIDGGGQFTSITIGNNSAGGTINNLTLANNKSAAGSHGGAILYQSGSSLSLNNVTIRNSRSAAANLNGGGLYCGRPDLTIRNSRIHGNSANEGGGLYLGNGCTNAQIINSSIYDNNSGGGSVSLGGGLTRPKSGGGIHVAGGASVTISNSRIYGNTAGTGDSGANGGGIGVYASSASAATVNINSSSIYNNLAYGSGGGLYMNGRTTLNVSGSAFYGNEAKQSATAGGGLMLKNEPGSAATHTITNTSIINNIAAGRGGGLSASMNFQATTSVVTLRHVTISGNTSSLAGTTQGAGLFVATTKLTLSNSIIFGNTADGSASNCIFSGLPTASQSAALTPIVSNNVVGGGSTSSSAPHCTANADSGDPLLDGPSVHGQGNFFIPRPGGSAVDTIGNADCSTTETVDQRGRARPYPAGGNCDKGAIEWYPPPPAPPRSDDGGGSGSGGSGGSGDDDGASTSESNAPPSTCETLPGNIEVKPMTESTQCQIVSGAGISDPKVREEATAAVDVWSWVGRDTKVCFKGESGSIRFIDTGAMPRQTMDKETFIDGGMICAMIDGPGIVALAPGPAPAQAQDPAPAQEPAPQAAAPACAAEKQSNAARADGSVVHIVKSGECLWTIANVYGLSFGELARLNGFEWNGQTLPPIQPGQEIIVSAAAG